MTVTDPGDSDVIDSPIRTADMVRIIDPGKVENTKWKRGDLIAQTEYQAEVERRTKARQSLPVAGPVVDRYTLREVNNQLVDGYVRVTDPGSTKLEKGKVVSKVILHNILPKMSSMHYLTMDH